MGYVTDEELVEHYRKGDEEAFAELLKRYIKPIYNFTFRYVANEGDASDITQDAFINAWKHIRRFDTNKKFKTWIFAIAKNASLNWLKKKKPFLFSEFQSSEGEENGILEIIPDTAPLPEELFEQKEVAENLSRAVLRLSPRYQTVLDLYYGEGFTFQEIAQILEEPLNTVKSRHRRALLELKKLLIP